MWYKIGLSSRRLRLFVIPLNFLKTLAAEHGVSDSEPDSACFMVGCGWELTTGDLKVATGEWGCGSEKDWARFQNLRFLGVVLWSWADCSSSRILLSEHPAQRSSGSSSNLAGPGIENTYPRQLWGEAPDVSVFHGRIEELATLEQWIVKDGCQWRW